MEMINEVEERTELKKTTLLDFEKGHASIMALITYLKVRKKFLVSLLEITISS